MSNGKEKNAKLAIAKHALEEIANPKPHDKRHPDEVARHALRLMSEAPCDNNN